MNKRNGFAISHLNHKSSVLCPNGGSVTSQYLALEQLDAHQKMMSHAKGRVDASAPKSLQSYISSIDRQKKLLWQQQSLFTSEASSFVDRFSELRSFHRKQNVQDRNADGKERGDLNSSASINKSTQAGIPTFSSKVGDKISWYLEAVSEGEFQIPTNQPMHHSNMQCSISPKSMSGSIHSSKQIKGDLMDWHKNSFTTMHRPFSPRILANNGVKSKVLEMRCYNPPRRKKESNSLNSSDTFESYEDEEDDDEEVEPAKQENEEPTKDNVNYQDWLNEQALRAQMRTKIKTNINDATNQFSILSHKIVTDGQDFKHVDPSSSLQTLSRNEEEKYLNFLSEVTEDILRSGIYTDRAIQRTFEFHLKFYQKDADRDKLKQLLEQVLDGLQITHDEGEDPLKRLGQHSSAKDSNSFSSSPPEKESLEFLPNGVDMLKISNFEPPKLMVPNQNETLHSSEATLTNSENSKNLATPPMSHNENS